MGCDNPLVNYALLQAKGEALRRLRKVVLDRQEKAALSVVGVNKDGKGCTRRTDKGYRADDLV